MSDTGDVRAFSDYDVRKLEISTSFSLMAWGEGGEHSVGLQIQSFPNEAPNERLHQIEKEASTMRGREQIEGLEATRYDDPLDGLEWLLYSLSPGLRGADIREVANHIVIPEFGSPPQDWLSLGTILAQTAGASGPGLISVGLVAKTVPHPSPALLLLTFLGTTIGVHYITPTIKAAGEITVEYLDLLRPSRREIDTKEKRKAPAKSRSPRTTAAAVSKEKQGLSAKQKARSSRAGTAKKASQVKRTSRGRKSTDK